MRRVQLRNAAVVVAGALVFFAAWAAVERVSAPTGQPAWAAVVASPLFHAVLGGAVFFAFRASVLARLGLAAVIPLISAAIFEVTIGSDPAYPYIAFLFGGLAAIAFLVGASAAAGVSRLAQRSHHGKQAT